MKKGKQHVIATGTSISGIPHIGNASDVIRGDAVRKLLEEKNAKVQFIWIADDSDPFRSVPKGMELLKDFLGFPVYDIPDPKKCHKNFVEHFAVPFLEELKTYGVEPKHYSAREIYKTGKLVEEIKTALDKKSTITKILNEYREHPLPEEYIPWNAICSKCGRISTTKATGWDNKKIVSYVCESNPEEKEKGLTVKGCGHVGESDITKGQGKLPWRVEWAARWKHFKVTCEPLGKDHASAGGSYETSKKISEEVFGWTAPYPVIYEFLLLNGEKISSSKGNVITLAQWNEIGEPEVLKFLFYKRLEKQRDVDLTRVPNMTDEYDEAEVSSDEKLKLMYKLSQIGKPKKLQVPFTLCATLSQIVPDLNFKIIKKRIEDMGFENFDDERLKARLQRSKNWVEKYGPDYLRFKILENPDEVKNKLNEKQKEGLKKLIPELDKKQTPEELHKKIYETARGIGINPNELFTAIYLALIGKERGPKAAMFLLTLEKKFVQERFKYL